MGCGLQAPAGSRIWPIDEEPRVTSVAWALQSALTPLGPTEWAQIRGAPNRVN